MITELPPMLRGSAEEQLRQLRDYLVRIASAADASGGAGRGVLISRGGADGSGKAAEELRAYAERLRALIVKNADATARRFSAFEDRIESIDGLFFYIRYAPVAAPTAQQMTIAPQEDTAYMGMCSTSEETAPADPAAYTWSRILGESAISLQIISSMGNIFKNGAISTTLTVKVWSGDEEVTALFDDNDFRWTRVSDDAQSDRAWNAAHFGGAKQIVITQNDVWRRATFFCELKD